MLWFGAVGVRNEVGNGFFLLHKKACSTVPPLVIWLNNGHLHPIGVPLIVKKQWLHLQTSSGHSSLQPEFSGQMAKNWLKKVIFHLFFGHREPTLACFRTPS